MNYLNKLILSLNIDNVRESKQHRDNKQLQRITTIIVFEKTNKQYFCLIQVTFTISIEYSKV